MHLNRHRSNLLRRAGAACQFLHPGPTRISGVPAEHGPIPEKQAVIATPGLMLGDPPGDEILVEGERLSCLR